jgi:hypothetical protein
LTTERWLKTRCSVVSNAFHASAGKVSFVLKLLKSKPFATSRLGRSIEVRLVTVAGPMSWGWLAARKTAWGRWGWLLGGLLDPSTWGPALWWRIVRGVAM